MAEKKVTKRDNFMEMLTLDEIQARPHLVECLEHEIELLSKKAGKAGKTAEENVGYAEAIVSFMTPGTMYQVAELTKNVPELAENDVKSQRVTHILGKLVEDGRVTNVKEKGKSYYSLAEADAE